MLHMQEHPTVQQFFSRPHAERESDPSRQLDAEWLRQLCLGAGADDVGFVEIDRPAISDQRRDILALFPWTKTLLSVICRMNREPIRSPARSVANLEFHHTNDEVNNVVRKIVEGLERHGTRRRILQLDSPWRWIASIPGNSGLSPINRWR
jgi:hypothetical protein